MYYIHLGKNGDFSSPEKLIIQYQEKWYYRKKTTDWEEMDEIDIRALLSGNDINYYAIEKSQFDSILSLWGGSRFGYKNMDLNSADFDPDYDNDYNY